MLRFLPAEAVRVADYVEVESGRKSARPQLAAAIALAQREGALLLVAKLDRLARSVAFLATLMESRVRFQAVDLPAADEFTLHILAAVAQKEASAISSRTRDALAAKKARGVVLGTPANLTPAARTKGLAARQANAQANVHNRQAGRPSGVVAGRFFRPGPATAGHSQRVDRSQRENRLPRAQVGEPTHHGTPARE